MIEPWSSKYLPLGCLDISITDSNTVLSDRYDLTQWRAFTRARSKEVPAAQATHDTLSPEIQATLLRTSERRIPASLWKTQWIQLAFRLVEGSAETIGRFRVYVLPFDVDRYAIGNRDDEKLGKALASLLRRLDYSPEAWAGHSCVAKMPQPAPFDATRAPTSEDSNLLAMFNNVPSPDPQPQAITDPDARHAMVSILESNLPGLKTTLYPYQRKSAALMLQRELEPGRVMDPRLRCCRDQNSRAWYYDSVTGLVLLEPRYYDGTRGGILAEEMGTGKTLMCLALILSTRREPTIAPEPFVAENPPRRRLASLLDMAAAAANRGSIPWQPYFDYIQHQLGHDHTRCLNALRDPANRAFYKVKTDPLVEPRRSSRLIPREAPTKEIHLGSGTLIVVPDNLVTQWREEIKKHTTGLQVLILVNRDRIPCVAELLTYDIVLFSQSRLEWIWGERKNGEGPPRDIYCPLEHIQWKRSIVDEGHKLGSRSNSSTSIVLDQLYISAMWIVTGTPTRNLYGVKELIVGDEAKQRNDLDSQRADLVHIGKMASKYLRVRPWANTREEAGDTVADWNVYVMNPAQHSKGQNRIDSLRSTLNSLIVRHRLADISTLLPAVDEKIVYLEGSYQDKLALNLFAMVIIFNSVQSQRTDIDYLFHPRQKKSLAELVRNLRQACFYGGVFWTVEDIQQALDVAEDFLKKGKISLSPEDEEAIRQAIDFGHVAVSNHLKTLSSQFHSLPLYVENFPGGHGGAWALDNRDDSLICTDAGLVLALQKFLNPCVDAPTSLQRMIDSGQLDAEGQAKREKALEMAEATSSSDQARRQNAQSTGLAGQTQLGSDRHSKPKSGLLEKSALIAIDDDSPAMQADQHTANITVADALASTRIISTVSAKLSYIVDAIVKYKDDEQIIVFYDNDNIAWYLAGVLEILQIHHLIYARAGINAERRAQYVTTFTHNPKFRVLLMDISQAAFGLDMRSASRIYFLSPVLNPQVQAQAIGRARRISQEKPVTVETLVLKGSIEEVIVDRSKTMTQAEQRKVMNSVIEDKLINDWIKNVQIMPMNLETTHSSEPGNGLAQSAMLKAPQFVFGIGFGRELHPDEDLLTNSPLSSKEHRREGQGSLPGPAGRIPFKIRLGGMKRSESPLLTSSTREATPLSLAGDSVDENQQKEAEALEHRPKKKVRVAWAD
ncbi:SNF2 family N-terminal domain-containing protein [Microdochium trichocladiopsis]|uniref:SNF2 family N-terminal domain-containing protein n=1 Tax=Microdochium trichocladiopsis TaxID=1682393 RepID=A0A9P9BVL5_9PEZI|nr:SNF2 family N-terminal domain-containing protein [Microdochium trichocladiopsis]KAH7039690.1 SNF2 family N-terminal domain-containing protein [Microdochium trichocladiopsis]